MKQLQLRGHANSTFDNISSTEHLDIGILVLGFSRPNLFERAVRSLKYLGLPESVPVYGAIDGPRINDQLRYEANVEVRRRAKQLNEEGLIDKLILRSSNLGTMRNVCHSVSEVLENHEFAFVLEDDLEVLPVADGALVLMCRHLGGDVKAFSLYVNRSHVHNVFLSPRFSSQGWGVSRVAWQKFDTEALKNISLSKQQLRNLKCRLGGDLLRGFKAFQKGALDSWAVPWNVHNFLAGGMMVYVPNSYLINNSHLPGAERTLGIKYDYDLASRPLSEFDTPNPRLNKLYRRHYSLRARIWRRIRSIFAYLSTC